MLGNPAGAYPPFLSYSPQWVMGTPTFPARTWASFLFHQLCHSALWLYEVGHREGARPQKSSCQPHHQEWLVDSAGLLGFCQFHTLCHCPSQDPLALSSCITASWEVSCLQACVDPASVLNTHLILAAWVFPLPTGTSWPGLLFFPQLFFWSQMWGPQLFLPQHSNLLSF